MVYDPGPLALLVLQRHLPGKHNQKDHAGKKKAAAAAADGDKSGTTGESSPSSVEGLPRMNRVPTVRQAAEGTNPNYGTTTNNPVYRDAGKAGQSWTPDMGPPPNGAYEENCTNSVQAFEMRMRGYSVQAAPLDVLDRYGYAAGRTYKETDDQVASSWRLPGGAPHGRSFASQEWRSFGEIDAEVAGWGDGGRGYMTVGKHVFNVVNQGGRVRYIEGQFDASPSRDATRKYRRKYGLGMFGGRTQEAKVIRLDDLEPAAGVLSAVVPA
jgi:papain fold toxin 1 (glutamine deamidase) of polymorphic toxin system